MRKISIWKIAAASALALMLGVSSSTAYTSITAFGSSNDGYGGFANSTPSGTEVWSLTADTVHYAFGTISNDTGQVIGSLLKEYMFDRSSGNSYSIEGVFTLTDGYGDDNNRIGMLLFNESASQTSDGGGGLYLQLNADTDDLSIVEGINGNALAQTNASGAYTGDGWIGTTNTFIGEIRFVSDFIILDFTFKDQDDVENTLHTAVLAANYTNMYFGFATKWRQRGDPSSNRNVPPIFDYNSFSVLSVANPPPDGTPPPAPINVTASADEFLVNLTWEAVDAPDLLYYNVYRSTTSGSYGTPVASNLTATNYLDTGLTNDTEYFYVLTAVDESLNESTTSTEVSATPILDIIPPGPPTNVVAEAFDTKVGLTWGAPGDPDVDYYNIYRSVSGGAEALLTNNIQQTEYLDDGLTNGILYTYTVTAVDNSTNQNESVHSDPSSATPEAAPLPPPFTGWTLSTPLGADSWTINGSSITYRSQDVGTINSSLLGEFPLNRAIGYSYTIEGVVRMVDGYADDNNRLGMYFFGDYPSISGVDGGLGEDESGAIGSIFNTDDTSANGAPGSDNPDALRLFVGVDLSVLTSTNRNQTITPYAQNLFGTEVTFSTDIEFVASTNGTTNIVITATMTEDSGAVTQIDPYTVPAADYTGDYFGFVNRARARNYVEGGPNSAAGRSLPWVMEYLDFSITTNSTGYVTPVISSISVGGGNVMVSGTSGPGNAGAQFRLQSATGLVVPGWSSVATNTFDGSGNFSTVHPVSGGDAEFYRLEVGP